jgi:hypothetical protein
MTIQELINHLQEAVEDGYPPDTCIVADVFDEVGHYTSANILLDADSSYLPIPYLALNVYEENKDE